MSQVFCPVPWSHVFVATNGSLLSCRIAASTEGKGLVLQGETTARAGDVPIREFRNHATLKNLRLNMLAGRETPEICRRCIDEEKHALVSRRALENQKQYLTLSAARAATAADGSINPTTLPVALYDLRLGNHCNLACGTCGPSQSTGWYKEWHATRHKGFRDAGERHQLAVNSAGMVHLPNTPYRWYEREDFWRELLAQTQGLRELHFSGGEPFFSLHHQRFLETLAARNLSGAISLDYNTNLTYLPEKLIETWKSFKKVSLGVSIDGVAAVNDYARYPSRFTEISENLKRIDNLPHVNYWCTTTISSLNVGRYPELVAWILSPERGRMNRPPEGGDRFFSYHLLRKRESLCVNSLPPAAKKIVRSRFEQFLREMDLKAVSEGEIRAVENSFRAILSAMESTDRSRLATEFHRERLLSDKFRQRDFAAVDPDIWREITRYASTAPSPGGALP